MIGGDSWGDLYSLVSLRGRFGLIFEFYPSCFDKSYCPTFLNFGLIQIYLNKEKNKISLDNIIFLLLNLVLQVIRLGD